MAEIIPVSALNRYVKSILDGDPILQDIAIKGEISNFVRNARSGHCYFSLIEGGSSVRAVMFRSDASRLRFAPENGMDVLARCRVSLYERDGAFQVYVEDLFLDGVGEAHLAFEQLKEKLEKEGLFAAEHKKALPAFPGCVGIVSSKTGAALQDILKVARRRCPEVELVLAPVRVQGLEAAGELAAAVKALDAMKAVECIIVARGGGAAEDLWVFNSEALARVVYHAKTPVVSAIGHEIDFSILDFVADMRAPTPSAAAEMVLPDMRQHIRQMEYLFANIQVKVQNQLDSCYNQWYTCTRHPAVRMPKERHRQNAMALSNTLAAMQAQVHHRLESASQQLSHAGQLAVERNPYTLLSRGYAVVKHNGTAIKSVQDVQPGNSAEVLMHDGTLEIEIRNILPVQEVARHGKEKDQL